MARREVPRDKAGRKILCPATAEDALTPRQAKFVSHFLRYGNAAKAAIAAGVSKKSGGQWANRTLKLEHVAEVLKKRQAAMQNRIEVTAERVLQELARIGFARMPDFAEWGARGVKLRDSKQLTEDQGAAVAQITQKSGNTREISIKLHDKVGALSLLGKSLGMFQDRVKIDNPEEVARAIVEAQQQIDGAPGAFPAPPPATKAA
jgi:phage terminase small subunit